MIYKKINKELSAPDTRQTRLPIITQLFRSLSACTHCGKLPQPNKTDFADYNSRELVLITDTRRSRQVARLASSLSVLSPGYLDRRPDDRPSIKNASQYIDPRLASPHPRTASALSLSRLNY